MNKCIYPGTFDPFTSGHLDILLRASRIFDEVIVSFLINQNKTPFFSLDERKHFVRLAAEEAGIKNYSTVDFSGLLIDLAEREGARSIVRGLRAVTDFEYELQMAAINKKLNDQIETVFLMTSTQYSYLSSSIVKEIAAHGGNIEGMLPNSYLLEASSMLKK